VGTSDTVPPTPDIPEPVQHVDRSEIGWAQQVYRFDNGLGASVIQVAPDRPDRGSDLVIIQWTSDLDWHVVGLDTAERVFGVAEYPDGLSEVEVRECLAKIQAYTPPANEGCTACGRPIHRVHGMWLDDLGRGHCPAGAKQGSNSHTTAAAPVPPPLTVYVVEKHVEIPCADFFWLLDEAAGAFPSGVAAMAALERSHGALVWDDQGQAWYPGDAAGVRWRIVELTLAGTPTGGAR
jgi:hypothetical protein